jgi:uncharacterized membrane protein SpoIIM required for sporulation
MHEENSETNHLSGCVIRALQRARLPILTVALTYVVSVAAGILMAHSGNEFALAQRDTIVSTAQACPILVALNQNDRLRAAVMDFAGNFFGAACNTLAGLGIVFAYPIMAYHGWVGGIVAVNSAHMSRLADPAEALYYVITLVLQLIPYTLAGGAGINLGVAFLRPRSPYQGEKWLGIPKEAIRDVLRIYLLVVPLFLLASLWEFFAR